MAAIAETVPALKAAGLVGIWNTNVVAGHSVLDEGAAALLAGNTSLAGREIPLEVALGTTHHDDRPWLFERIRRVRQTGGPITAEFRIVTVTGDVRWILCRGIITPDAAGRMMGSGAYIDTTDNHASPFIPAAARAERIDDPLAAAADHCLEAHHHLKRAEYTDLRRAAELLLSGIGRALAERRG